MGWTPVQKNGGFPDRVYFDVADYESLSYRELMTHELLGARRSLVLVRFLNETVPIGASQE